MKRKRLKIIIISITIIAILVATFLWIFFNTDFFRTKRSAFHRYFETIPEALDIVEKEEKEFSKYREKKEETPYIRKSNISIESSSNIADSNILDKIKTTVIEKNDAQNEKLSVDISINNAKDTIENISVLRNKNIIGAKCIDVVTGYVCIKNENLPKIIEDISKKETIIANEINRVNLSKVLETTKVEKNKIENLNEIIKNNIPVTAYNKEKRNKVKIGEKIYTTTAYSIELSQDESATLQINLLTKISQDSILMDYITSKLKLLNINEDYASINSLNAKLKSRINELKQNPKAAKKIKVILHEYKQKNIKTEIIYGENQISITHLTNAENELSAIKIQNKEYSLEKKDGKYIVLYADDSEEKSLKIEYNQTGTLENNDLKNYMTISKKDGIKSITYKYEDSINFTNDIGTIKDLTNENRAVLNDYSDDEVKSFVEALKKKINQIYINKGATIGINLDPIFEISNNG